MIESELPKEVFNRNVVNFTKTNVQKVTGGVEGRVIACWLHVPVGSTLGGPKNRVLIRGWSDEIVENWSLLDQRLLNREYWEQGCPAFNVEPETLFPVDVSLWHSLAITGDGFKVTFFDEREPVGRQHDKIIYDVLNLNGILAVYQGRTSGLDEESPRDLLIPSADGWFLHYRIEDEFSVDDWLKVSAIGESVGCRELMMAISSIAVQAYN